MAFPFHLVRSVLHGLDPELSHFLTLYALRLGVLGFSDCENDALLSFKLWGLDFDNPIGLAAGFDKNAQVIGPMLRLGFGSVEVGTITPKRQVGNVRPRVFRLPRDLAVINRLGFNNQGLQEAQRRLEKPVAQGVVGANIGPNRNTLEPITDYISSLPTLHNLVDYLAINVSSPNTPGLRGMQKGERLNSLLSALVQRRRELADCNGRGVPLLLKIAPDLEDKECEMVAELVISHRFDGLIISNTTVGGREELRDGNRRQEGGLSGAPLFNRSTALLARMYGLVGEEIPLIGVGGVMTGWDAYRKIRAGATIVQLYTGLIYHGPGLVGRIKKELSDLLKADGFSNFSQAVGVDVADFRPNPQSST